MKLDGGGNKVIEGHPQCPNPPETGHDLTNREFTEGRYLRLEGGTLSDATLSIEKDSQPLFKVDGVNGVIELGSQDEPLEPTQLNSPITLKYFEENSNGAKTINLGNDISLKCSFNGTNSLRINSKSSTESELFIEYKKKLAVRGVDKDYITVDTNKDYISITGLQKNNHDESAAMPKEYIDEKVNDYLGRVPSSATYNKQFYYANSRLYFRT